MNALEFPALEISVHKETDYTLIIRRVLQRLIMGPPILRKVPLMRKVYTNGLLNHAEILLRQADTRLCFPRSLVFLYIILGRDVSKGPLAAFLPICIVFA